MWASFFRPPMTTLVLLLACTYPAAAQTADALFEEGRAAQLAGRHEEAERIYREYLRRFRARPEVLANLGVILARRDNFAEATGLYRQALRLDPSQAPLYLNLGLAQMKQGQHLAALASFDQFLKSSPGHRQARQLRAMTLLELERFAEAEKQYRELSAAGPAAAAAAGDPRDLTISLGLASALLRQQKVAEARTVLEPVLSRTDSAEVQFTLGQAFLQEGRAAEALEAFERARALNPELPNLRVQVGAALWRTKKSAEALAEWRAELTARPQSFEATYMLGAALALNTAEREQALTLLKRALELRPRHPYANFQAGKLLWQSERERAQALPYLERATAADRDFREAFFLYGTALQAAGRKAEAARAFARVREISAKEIARQQDLFVEESR